MLLLLLLLLLEVSMKKILCTFLATIFLSFSFYSSVNAAEASAFSLNSTTAESITIDEDIIQKTDPFISLNDNGQFYITDLNEIKTVLSSDELSIVQNKISEILCSICIYQR